MSTANRQTQLLAVLVVDQVGSTAFLQRVGDARANEVRAALQSVLRQAVAEHDGRIVVGTGDGILAVFDGASKGLDAGLAMHRRLVDAHRSGQVPTDVEIRVGVAVGDISIGEQVCHGTPVVEAAQLEAAAPPGAMLCTDAVKVLSAGRSSADFVSREQIHLPGLSQPLSAWLCRPPT